MLETSYTPQPACTKPGDSVTFRGNLECLVVVSACPQDMVNINGFHLSPLRLDLDAAACPNEWMRM